MTIGAWVNAPYEVVPLTNEERFEHGPGRYGWDLPNVLEPKCFT
jgi:hypothetical protein